MTPKLSIITINRNNAEGLKKTMQSVFSQTFKDFEYIIIDGASTDDSLAVIQSFDHSSIQSFYWISEPDTGIYNAMNKGINAAKGEYLQFLNSGDILASLLVLQNLFDNYRESAPILYGNMLKQFSDRVYRDKGFDSTAPTMLSFYSGTLNHSSAFIKKDLFNRYGLYDEKFKIVSDWKWYLEVIGLNNEIVLYKDVDVVIFDLNGISSTNKILDNNERRKVLEELIPKNILVDYDKYAVFMRQINRVNRNPVAKKIFWLMDRILFKLEKINTK